MTETRRFIKESVIYTAGEILSKSLAFILIPIYTRFLTKSDFGIYTLVITIWPILVILYGKGFGGYIIRGYYDLSDRKLEKDFFGSIIAFSLLLSLILAVITHIFGDSIFQALFKSVSYKPFIQFAVGIAVIKLFINNMLSIYRAMRKPVIVVSLSIFNFFVTAVLIIFLVVILKKELWGVLWGQIFALGIVSIVFIFYISKNIRFTLQKKHITAAVLFMLPLIPHAIAGWIVNLSDRVLIERLCNLEDLAIYALGYQLAMSLEILINSMNQAWIPFFYTNVSNPDQNKELKKSSTFFFTTIVMIGLGLSLFSEEIIYIAGKTDYMASAKIFPLIIVAYIFYSIYFMCSAPILHAKKTFIFPLITIFSGAVNIGLNLLWLPKYGYIAAAYSTIISYILLAGLTYLVSLKFQRIPFQIIKISSSFSLAVLLYSSLYLFPALGFLLKILLKFGIFSLFPILLIGLKIIAWEEVKTYARLFLGRKRIGAHTTEQNINNDDLEV